MVVDGITIITGVTAVSYFGFMGYKVAKSKQAATDLTLWQKRALMVLMPLAGVLLGGLITAAFAIATIP